MLPSTKTPSFSGASDLATLLTAAVQAGWQEEAVKLARSMAKQQLKVEIVLPQEDFEERAKEKEFSVRVHIEDRESEGCHINLMVKPSDTIGDLKKKVMLLHNFPIEVQRWIIAKKIHCDREKLYSCGVRGPGHTLYLYLVTARSVGLTRSAYDAQRDVPDQLALAEASHWLPAVAPLEDQEPLSPARVSPVNTMSRETSVGGKRSLTLSQSGSALIQGLLNASPPPSPALAQRPEPDVEEKKASNLDNRVSVVGLEPAHPSNVTPFQRISTSEKHEPDDIGWQCKVCTFINVPTRPGCLMCSSPCPPEYKVPAGYEMTPEEVARLEEDQRLERLTRETVPLAQAASGQPTTKRPLHQITHQQLSENLKQIQEFKTEGNNQIQISHLIEVPGGSDWANVRGIDVTGLGQQVVRAGQDRAQFRDLSPEPVADLVGRLQIQAEPGAFRNAVAPSGSYHTPAHGGYTTMEPVQFDIGGDIPSDEENSHA